MICRRIHVHLRFKIINKVGTYQQLLDCMVTFTEKKEYKIRELNFAVKLIITLSR